MNMNQMQNVSAVQNKCTEVQIPHFAFLKQRSHNSEQAQISLCLHVFFSSYNYNTEEDNIVIVK